MTKSFCLCYDFNPRSPHGERPSAGLRTQYFPFISIHAPRTGSDRTGNTQVKARFGFQSTLPARGATRQFHADAQRDSISIHAPRTGSDTSGGAFRALLSRFQSTLPARGATRARHALRRTWQVSTHAPRTGSDRPQPEYFPARNNFNPRSPHGERRHHARKGQEHEHFNPRSPHGERRMRRGEVYGLQ